MTDDLDPARRIDIIVTGGDTYNKQWTLTNPDGTPYSLAGATVTLKVVSASGKPLLSFATGDGLAIAANVLTFSKDVPKAEGTHYYDFKIVKNQVTRAWVKGSFIIRKTAH